MASVTSGGQKYSYTYDSMGNIATFSAPGKGTVTCTYNLEGLRTSKTVGGITHNYLYAGDKLMRMSWGTNTIDFFYVANGVPYVLKYNGTAYYYVTNNTFSNTNINFFAKEEEKAETAVIAE